MGLREKSAEYYAKDYNCAESLLRAVDETEKLGLPECAIHAIGGFGGGCGCGEMCGAVAVGIEAISLKYINDREHTAPECRRECRRFIKEHKERYGGILCRELKPRTYSAECKCKNTIGNTAELLEEFLKK